jgi:hypothetical protein
MLFSLCTSSKCLTCLRTSGFCSQFRITCWICLGKDIHLLFDSMNSNSMLFQVLYYSSYALKSCQLSPYPFVDPGSSPTPHVSPALSIPLYIYLQDLPHILQSWPDTPFEREPFRSAKPTSGLSYNRNLTTLNGMYTSISYQAQTVCTMSRS